MARNFVEDDDHSRLTYGDGFRFGFGFFVATLLGVTVLGALAFGVSYFTNQLH